jgi:hypothetical protein
MLKSNLNCQRRRVVTGRPVFPLLRKGIPHIEHLANAGKCLSRYHIFIEPAPTILAQAPQRATPIR